MGAKPFGVSDMSWHTESTSARTSPTGLSCPGTGWKPALKWQAEHVSGPAVLHWEIKPAIYYEFSSFCSICCKYLLLSNLYSLGSTNSPDSMIIVKNILKSCFHYFPLEVWAINSGRMLLLYWKCSFCLTKTSCSYSVLLQWKGEGDWAHRLRSVCNSPAELKRCSRCTTPAPLLAKCSDRPAAVLAHWVFSVLSFVVHHTRNSYVFSQGKMNGSLV